MSEFVKLDDVLAIAMQYCPDDDGTCSKAGQDLREMLDEIENLPTVQVDVIHCRDCRYAHMTYDGYVKYCDCSKDEYGNLESLYLDGDFFCGFAERKV